MLAGSADGGLWGTLADFLTFFPARIRGRRVRKRFRNQSDVQVMQFGRRPPPVAMTVDPSQTVTNGPDLCGEMVLIRLRRVDTRVVKVRESGRGGVWGHVIQDCCCPPELGRRTRSVLGASSQRPRSVLGALGRGDGP